MRRAVVTVLSLATLAAAGTASAARDPKDPQQKHTAADTKQARSIALGLADLGTGWRKAAAQKPVAPCTTEPDESSLVQTARIDPTFVWSDGITSVGSEIDTFKTAAQAMRDWRLSTLDLARRCLLETARKELAKQHVSVSILSAVAVKPPKLGERSLHYRVVFQLRRKYAGKTQYAQFVTELILVGIGRTSVVLHASSPGAPLPSSGLNGLAKVLTKRLVVASGGI
jgi:hypothetical protein